jgi:hypothetical protein
MTKSFYPFVTLGKKFRYCRLLGLKLDGSDQERLKGPIRIHGQI